jgi:integrase
MYKHSINVFINITSKYDTTRMVDAGIQLPVVKQILNHANIQTTMRYAHTMSEQEVTAIEALANYNC